MKEVWVMRHGIQETTEEASVWNRNARLSTEGQAAVKRVYETHLKDVRFSLYATSPLLRAMETAAIVANGKPVETMTGLVTISELAWEGMFRLYPWYHGIDGTPALFHLQAGLLMTEGEHTFQCIERVAAHLREGKKALLVSHHPLIETALAVATNTWPPPLILKKGEVVVFVYENGKFSHWKHLPLPS